MSEQVWKELAEMRSAGQTYDELLEDLIEERKKRRLAEDVKAWRLRKREDYVPLSEIED